MVASCRNLERLEFARIGKSLDGGIVHAFHILRATITAGNACNARNTGDLIGNTAGILEGRFLAEEQRDAA